MATLASVQTFDDIKTLLRKKNDRDEFDFASMKVRYSSDNADIHFDGFVFSRDVEAMVLAGYSVCFVNSSLYVYKGAE